MLGQDSVSEIVFQLIMFISLPLRETNAEEPWENKMVVFNYIFSFLGKTVENCLCNFHCCCKFSRKTSTVYFWDLLCHVLVGHDDLDIGSKFTGDKAFTEGAQELYKSLFPKIQLHNFFSILSLFYEHLNFLSRTGFHLLIFLVFGVFSIGKKLYEFWLPFVQHSALLEKTGLLYSWRKVAYELKSNLGYSRKTSDIQGNTAVKPL